MTATNGYQTGLNGHYIQPRRSINGGYNYDGGGGGDQRVKNNYNHHQYKRVNSEQYSFMSLPPTTADFQQFNGFAENAR